VTSFIEAAGTLVGVQETVVFEAFTVTMRTYVPEEDEYSESPP
jgi:hypothetical protein